MAEGTQVDSLNNQVFSISKLGWDKAGVFINNSTGEVELRDKNGNVFSPTTQDGRARAGVSSGYEAIGSTNWPNITDASFDTGRTAVMIRYQYTAPPGGFSEISIRFGNTGIREADASAPAVVGSLRFYASVEYPAGTFTPFYFGDNGATSGATPDGTPGVTSLAIASALDIPAGATYWMRWYIVPSSTLATIPNAGYLRIGSGDGYENDTTPTSNKCLGGTVTLTATRQIFTPPIFVGGKSRIVSGVVPRVPTAVAICTSHGAGVGDDFYNVGRGGFIDQALLGKAGLLNYSAGGEQASYYANPQRTSFRLGRAGGVFNLISDLGTNDIVNGATLASLIGTSISPGLLPRYVWGKASQMGASVFQCTVLPTTSSVDGWITQEGQTFNNGATVAVAQQLNAAYRSGSVASAFSSLTQVFDTASTVEAGGSTAPTGKWDSPMPFKVSAAPITASTSTTVTLDPASNVSVGDMILVVGATTADKFRKVTGYASGVVTIDVPWFSNPTTSMTVYCFTPAFTGTVTTGGVSNITDSGQTFTAANVGQRLLFYTDVSANVLGYGGIICNFAGGLLVCKMWCNGTYVSRNDALSTPASIGSKFFGYNARTIDGNHPARAGANRMATAIDTTKLSS